MSLTIREAAVSDLPRLPELFDYNDVPGMIAVNARRITSGKHSIFLLWDSADLIGSAAAAMAAPMRDTDRNLIICMILSPVFGREIPARSARTFTASV